MTPEARKAADSYYADAGSWAAERTDALRASRRVAWIVAIVAVLMALALAVTLMLLLPLKTVVPYTLLVDRQTGYVQKLDPIGVERIAPDSALTQSFLVQYVLAREGFDVSTVQRDYRKVALWSADSARGDYVATMQVGNPESPLVRLPRNTGIEARVRSVSSLGKQTALVRFETILRSTKAAAQTPQNWVAIVSYRYSDAPMSVEDRFINPLGFQVTRYRRNAETLPTPAEAPAELIPTGGAVVRDQPSGEPIRPTLP